MNKPRLLFSFIGISTIVLSLVYISLPVGHIPPYDANLIRLAESELQGYCAGETFWKTGGAGNGSEAASCRATRGKTMSDASNLQVVPEAFCRAIVDAGWQEGTNADCRGILSSSQLWPTYDGALSDQWNRARPYPGSIIILTPGSSGDSSRTGGHQGNDRGDAGMRGYP